MSLLEDARKKINSIDKEMARLFEERMHAVELVAEHKRLHGLPILDKERETTIILKNSEYIADKTIREYYVNYLKSNMDISKQYQLRLMEGMKVAYCGTEGAFAHIATKKIFPTAQAVPYTDFQDTYTSVVSGECDAAVLPLENSYNGEVGQVTDLMFSGSLFVNNVMELAVTQDLLVLPDAKLENIKKVVSHPHALGQCASYIKEHGFTIEEFSNTALAAKHIKEMNDPTIAAIASAEAAAVFGLKVIEHNINASRSNTTRFAVFTRSENVRPTNEKEVHTIILFTVRNEAGALAKAIEIIGKHGFNMRSLRSRPMKELLWQYYFYVEAEGNVNSPDGKLMMTELRELCDKLRAVGTF